MSVFLKGAALGRAGTAKKKERAKKSEEKGAKKGRAKKEWRLYGLLKNSILGGAALSALR
jgi:hypothetical protein